MLGPTSTKSPQEVPSTLDWEDIYANLMDYEKRHPDKPILDADLEYWAWPHRGRLPGDLRIALTAWMGNLGFKYRRGATGDPTGRRMAWRRDRRERNLSPVRALTERVRRLEEQVAELSKAING